MDLNSGAKIIRQLWTELPMPTRVITRINSIRRNQQMPSTITYANRRGDEIVNTIHDYENETDDTDIDDSTYAMDLSEDDEMLEFDDPHGDDKSSSSFHPDYDDQDDDYDDGNQYNVNQGEHIDHQSNEDDDNDDIADQLIMNHRLMNPQAKKNQSCPIACFILTV
eukprot:7109231-Ditylum_brightwellii.AAC.1